MNNSFNLTADNKYWNLLQVSAQLRKSAGQKHLELFKTLEANQVQFGDIEAFLLNQAKKVGLYRKIKYNRSTGKMAFPPKKELVNLAWYHEMTLFTRWVARKYVSYKMERVQAKKATQKVPKRAPIVLKVSRNAKPVVEAPLPKGHKVEAPSVKANVPVTNNHTGTQTPSTDKDNKVTGGKFIEAGCDSSTNAPAESITRPLIESLTDLQVQTVVLQNLSVLGKVALSAGASDEFNALMLALGQEDQCVVPDVVPECLAGNVSTIEVPTDSN